MQPDQLYPQAPGRILRQPTDYWAYIPDPLPPSLAWPLSLVKALAEANRSLGELSGRGNALPDPHLLVRPFIHREAVLSSRIEGTRTTLGQLYAYETGQLALFQLPAGAQEEAKEVHNYVQALQYGLERLDRLPISLRLIRELHARLMASVRGEYATPGEFRRSQNWIGPPGSTLQNATFVPPPVAEMHITLDQFEKFIHAPSDLPHLVRLALLHYQFEAIHPFLDGNGRVGRLLISLLFCAWDLLPQPLLYLSAYFEAHRQDYYDLLLAVSQRGAWTDWLQFFLHGIQTQAEDATARIRRLQDLRATYRARFQETRAAARLLQFVDSLFEKPVFTIPQVADLLEVNYPTARRYVHQLADAGIIREITGQARYRVYRADAILDAIESPMEID